MTFSRGDLVLVTGVSCFGERFVNRRGVYEGTEDGLILVRFPGRATVPAFEVGCVRRIES